MLTKLKRMIQQGDAQAMKRQSIGRRQSGRSCAEHDDGLTVGWRHKNFDRIHTPAARARRWDVERRTRGPKTAWSGRSMRSKIREYTARMISATLSACRSLLGRQLSAVCALT